MDHHPLHSPQDVESHSDSLTGSYDDIGSWGFLSTLGKDFNHTFAPFDGTNIPQESIATLLPGLSQASTSLCGGTPSYERLKGRDLVTPERNSTSALDPALLSPFSASSRATPGTGPTKVHDLPSTNHFTGSHRGTPGPSRNHSVTRLVPEPADSPALESLLVRMQGLPCPSTPVIRPPRDAAENFPILVHHFPRNGLTRRPESPFKIILDLAQVQEGLSSYDRIGSWNWLRLPPGTTTRQNRSNDAAVPEDTLNLSVAVQCFSDPSIPVNPCQKCRDREAARVQRNLENRISRNNSTSRTSEDSMADSPPPSANKGKSVAREQDTASGGSGIVVFNCTEYQDFREGRVVLPMRVTCYSRHHNEKVGFQLTFSMTDSCGRLVGRGSAGPVLITDPHSNASARAKRAHLSTTMVPRPKKRRQRGFSSTPTDVSGAEFPPTNDVRFASNAGTTPSSHTQSQPSIGNVNPSSLRPGEQPSAPTSSTTASQTSSDSDSAVDSAPNNPEPSRDVPRPRISAVIPESGSVLGGIKITVLGQNFTPQHQCVFGQSVCTWTAFWNEGALTCLLPSSAVPRRVIVSIHGFPISVGGGIPGTTDGEDLQWFTYVDNNDELMKLALQVVGFMQSGHVEDPKDVAQRIVNGGSTSTQGGIAFSPELMRYLNICSESGIVGSANLEILVVELLGLANDVTPTGSLKNVVHEAISCCRISGRTMLHVSAALGYLSLLDYIIRTGIDLDTRDANGHTALHFAALYGRTQCAEILVSGGADMEIVDAHGQDAMQIAFRNGHSTVGTLLTVHEDSPQEVEDIEYDYEDDDAAPENNSTELHSAEDDEQTCQTDDGFAMTVNEARKVSPSSPKISTHLTHSANDVVLEFSGTSRRQLASFIESADVPRAPPLQGEHVLPQRSNPVKSEPEVSPEPGDTSPGHWRMVDCVKHSEATIPSSSSHKPKPNDEATNSNGIAVCQDNPFHEHSPNHESKLSSGPKGALGTTPSSWKASQSRSDFRDAESSAAPPDSTQCWEGMLATLFDAGGSSSPSVSVTPSEGSTLLDFSPYQSVICNEWNPEYSPNFSGTSTPSCSPLSSSPKALTMSSAYTTDSLGLWLGRSKSSSFSSTTTSEEQTLTSVGAAARSRAGSSASEFSMHSTPGVGESSSHPLSVLDSDPVNANECQGPVGKHQYKAARFVCPVEGCGSTFSRAFNLRGHLRSHRDERPFVCKWPHCGKGFARAHDCKRHESLHLGIRPFTCTGCEKTFARLDALNRHLTSNCRPCEPPPGGHLHTSEVMDTSAINVKTEMT